MKAYEEKQEYTVFLNGDENDKVFDSLSAAKKSAKELSLNPILKGEVIYIFNNNQGHIEGMYKDGRSIKV